MKPSLFYLWSIRKEFSKYFIVGVSGLVLDLGTLILLKEKLGLLPEVAVISNQALLLVYNFTLNKYWSFRNRDIPHQQMVRYGILAGWNYAFSAGTMYLFRRILGFDYRLVRLCAIAAMVSWNFFLYKYWVYRTKISKDVIHTPQRGAP